MPYTTSQAWLALGSLLEMGDGVTPVEGFTVIAEITDISKSGAKADTVDVTNMQSPSGYREFISGLRDAGELSLSANWITTDAQQIALQTKFDAGTKTNFKIVLPQSAGGSTTPGEYAFAAVVTGLDFSLAPGKQGTLSVKMKISGKPVFTPGT